MLTLRMVARQRRGFLYFTLGSLVLTGLLWRLGEATGQSPALWLLPLLGPVISLGLYFASFASYTTVDQTGIQTRLYVFAKRTCPWEDVSAIWVRSLRGSRNVKITRTNGRRFTLGLPLDAPVAVDPDFQATYQQIIELWQRYAPDTAAAPDASHPQP